MRGMKMPTKKQKLTKNLPIQDKQFHVMNLVLVKSKGVDIDSF